MVAIIVVLLALPIGLLIRNRLGAYLAFAVVFAQVYTFQTGLLVMEWTNGATAAFPRSTSPELLDSSLGYLAFTSVVYLVGFGLVTLGHWLRGRRRHNAEEVRLDR
ncbi:hypothetical protein OHA25_47740 [Nonomuraea sp. NBC_00507]|uniref:hypothetical protein n=1 Tax=Nonomuraea sp. NBC_00507 TaxID=2976002 RepID=UPI002E197E0F